jgi:transcriptional regulator with XRE-family HTH domain
VSELHHIDTGRIWVRIISKQAFRQYMEFRGFTNESLADAAKCSTATIAFLRSNGKSARDSVGAKTARRIEAALNAPPGSLFSAEVLVASGTAKPAA